jgi:hypothetical protein
MSAQCTWSEGQQTEDPVIQVLEPQDMRVSDTAQNGSSFTFYNLLGFFVLFVTEGRANAARADSRPDERENT